MCVFVWVGLCVCTYRYVCVWESENTAHDDPPPLLVGSAALLVCMCVCVRERKRRTQRVDVCVGERERGEFHPPLWVEVPFYWFVCVCACVCVCECVYVCACERDMIMALHYW